MIQDFDGLVGPFSRRRQCMAAAGVCAVTLSPTDEREFTCCYLLVAQSGTDIIHERDLEYAMQRMRLLTRALVTQRCF
jgi:hypothetical protein